MCSSISAGVEQSRTVPRVLLWPTSFFTELLPVECSVVDSGLATGQWWAKWRLSTFDLYPWGEGHGVQGQICDILRPQLAIESLPAPLATQILTLWIHTSGGRGCEGGSDIRSMSSIRPICKCWCPPLPLAPAPFYSLPPLYKLWMHLRTYSSILEELKKEANVHNSLPVLFRREGEGGWRMRDECVWTYPYPYVCQHYVIYVRMSAIRRAFTKPLISGKQKRTKFFLSNYSCFLRHKEALSLICKRVV